MTKMGDYREESMSFALKYARFLLTENFVFKWYGKAGDIRKTVGLRHLVRQS